MEYLVEMGKKAKKASKQLMIAGEMKNIALENMAKKLVGRQEEIITANKIDIELAIKNNTSPSMIDRLTLDEGRIKSMAQGILDVKSLKDPVGQILEGDTLPNGLRKEKITVPMGVMGIIFEARPNVTSDAAALCLKSGSSVILRGGKEAYNSNRKITDIIEDAIEEVGLDPMCVQLIDDITRQSAVDLMNLTGYIDVLIPRGGAGLIKTVVENSKVPVIETGVGNCHAFVDESADLDMAVDIIFNGKTSRPSVCNALETVLVHKNIAKKALPKIKAKLDEKDVVIFGCEKTMEIISCETALEEHWYKEFLDYAVSVKVVDDIDEAVEHIEKYSTHHSEVIITKSYENSEKFTALVDSAAVYVNASTRFTDGGELGFGAEIGISTQKLHARGPMGLNQLVSYKYIIRGNGQIR